uniref:Uncharacterized protein n=1 Tax=Cannabis sativa TaxID=3483 RepID=A0A803NPT1_CANSA
MTQRPGKEHQTSHRMNTTETPHSGRNGGEFEQAGDEILERRKLERDAAAARAAQDDAPLNQLDTSNRRPRGRPRGSIIKRHGDTPRGITLEFPRTLRRINLRMRGTSQ